MALGVLVALVAGACRTGTVLVTFRPEVGATYRYGVSVRSETTVRIGRNPPETRQLEVKLNAEHTVLEASDEGVRVEVVLSEPGTDDRTFVVVFDRAAQLEAIEGMPDDTTGTIGIPEIFPAAAGAPPPQPLGPGARWAIDDEVTLPGADPGARLVGTGRLVGLGVVDGEDVARIRSSARLPASTLLPLPRGDLRFDGSQTTRYRSTVDLDDGAVREAYSTTVGSFRLELGPPPGQTGAPVAGSLEVRVESETERLG